MKTMFSICGVGAVLLALSAAPVGAEAYRKNVASFDEVNGYVNKLGEPGVTVLVMDDDDTLTMMSCPDQNKPETCQYLGGPAWFDWQQAQVEAMAQPRVADTFDELLTASDMLFAINDMPYTDSGIPEILKGLTQKKVRLLVETARGSTNASATERQFSNLVVKKNGDEDNLLKLISGHSLDFGPDEMPSRISPYKPCGNSRLTSVTYQQGIMYLSGENKGVVLECMLNTYNASDTVKPITKVVFIDDTEDNVVDVFNAFKKSEKYEVYALYYTALSEHKEALTGGEMAPVYQDYAMRRWEAIQEVFEGALQNPVLP